jgi:hypothetical protein
MLSFNANGCTGATKWTGPAAIRIGGSRQLGLLIAGELAQAGCRVGGRA